LNSSNTTTKIPSTLTNLISDLSEANSSTYNTLIHAVNFNADDFKASALFSEDCYTRNCIVDNEKYELILICWCEGQKTPIHDHGGEECWVKVIEGEFEENVYKKNNKGELNLVRSAISKPNQVTYMKDFMGFHSLQNMSNKKAMSLHLYAKPIRKCNIFNEETKTLQNKELTYDTTIKI